MRLLYPVGLVLSLAALLPAEPAHAACGLAALPPGTEVAELETSMGSICIRLLRDGAPGHVDNFRFYLENGLLEDTFFHRSVPGFIVQGGGFTVGALDYEAVPPTNGPVTNEPCTLDTPVNPGDPGGVLICSERGNERGTLALAKVGGDPDSGTTNWFLNLVDNRTNLDNQNGGFTVFGRVMGDGMSVIDAIAALSLATEDDLAWMETSFESFPIPLLEPPLSTVFGCWDPAQQATVLDTPSLPSLFSVQDPVMPDSPFFPFTVSAPCGTPTTLESFVPNPGTGGCPDDDRLSVETTGPRSQFFTGGVGSFVALTCQQTQQALADRALWRAAYRAHFNSQLVFVESAVLHIAAPPIPSVSPGGSALLAGLLLGSGSWMLRRRIAASRSPRP
jgi:cyclophilin family peptidyl-prolyl cis-trans isomerase